MIPSITFVRNDVLLGLVAVATAMLSGIVMNNIGASPASATQMTSAPIIAPIEHEVVSQNAIAPEARPDAPAIAMDVPCPVTLELMDEGNAFVGGTLLAPCNPNQELVITHAGLTISGKTLASGALFFSLPALQHPALVDVRLSSGETVTAELDIVEAKSVRRLAVQWPFRDGFAIHAFENGAQFGDKGHIWPENALAPHVGQGVGQGAGHGYLTTLGDATVDLPLMAQVYTFGPAKTTDLLIEAVVTKTNCDLEMMGDVISARAGAVQKTELTVAMPDCAAVDEFVQVSIPEGDIDVALLN